MAFCKIAALLRYLTLVLLLIFTIFVLPAAADPLYVYLEITGNNIGIQKDITRHASRKLSNITEIVQVEFAEEATVIISYAFNILPEKQGYKSQIVFYSLAYGINELGIETDPPVSVPRFITHAVKWCTLTELTQRVRSDIDEVHREFLSLIH